MKSLEPQREKARVRPQRPSEPKIIESKYIYFKLHAVILPPKAAVVVLSHIHFLTIFGVWNAFGIHLESHCYG